MLVQYQRPLAKPPKAIRPTRIRINPIQKLQMIHTMIPAITIKPPVLIPNKPVPSPRANVLLL
jgi:hypothetical protein